MCPWMQRGEMGTRCTQAVHILSTDTIILGIYWQWLYVDGNWQAREYLDLLNSIYVYLGIQLRTSDPKRVVCQTPKFSSEAHIA